MLLRYKCFYAAKVLPVAHQDDLAAHIGLQLLELLKIIGRSVICVHNFRLNIARRRHAVVRHHDSRIVLKGIAFDMLAGWSVHRHTRRSSNVYADFDRIVEPGLVFDNFGVQAGVAKALPDPVGQGDVILHDEHPHSRILHPGG